jgi:signal transduction histidine kinase
MVDLVRSLLNLSRVEAGRLAVVPESTDIGQLVDDLAATARTTAESRRQHFEVKRPKTLPMLVTDKAILREVISSLLTNALKYTPEGGNISLAVGAEGEEIVFHVADNGMGIPRDQQGAIFSKFARADNAKRVDPGGTGLGLYLVKKFTELLSGRAWFESEESGGSIFHCAIPLKDIKAKEGPVRLA